MLELLSAQDLSPADRYRAGQALFREHGLDQLEAEARALAADGRFDEVFEAWVPVLDDWNHFTLAIAWYRDAVRDGRSPYLVSDVIVRVWEKLGNASALAECDTLEAWLDTVEFREHGDDFHKDMARRAIAGFRRVIAYEDGSGEHPRDVADGLHDAVRGAIWERGWQLLRIDAHDRMVRIARLYPHIYGGDLDATLLVVRWFLTPYGEWQQALDVLDEAEVSNDTPAALIRQVDGWRIQALRALGREDEAETLEADLFAALDEDNVDSVGGVLLEVWWADYARRHEANEDWLTALRAKLDTLADRLADNDLPPALLLLRAHLCEDLGDHEGALGDYLRASKTDPGGYMPEMFWRACAFLASHGHWAEAARIQSAGALAHWVNYRTPARLAPETRHDAGPLLPERAVMLNTNGIGDDLWRIVILQQLFGRAPDYACVVDRRLLPVVERSFPEMHFLTRSQTRGAFAVDAAAFHADREGLHRTIESTMTSRAIQEAIEDYGEVVISEDVFSAYFRHPETLDNWKGERWLATDDALVKRATDWLATLPGGNLNIGLSWRSNRPHRVHFELMQLGPLLKLPGINWVILQYTVTPEELAEAEAAFGVKFHLMPGVDLMDDIDQVMAIGSALDLMIATPSTIEPLVALTGTPTLSLGSGYHGVSGYRIAPDGESDLVAPALTHISQRRFGSKQGIVDEAARRVGALVARHRKV